MTKKKRINLFELAEDNSPRLQGQYQQLKDNCDEAKISLLNSFREKIQEEWNLSVNIDDWKFVSWLDTGNYKNIYEVKKVQAKELVNKGEMDVSEKRSAQEESLKKHLKQLFAHRTIFDSSFVDGKKFKYTALNIGGMGSDKYGLYCVIIGREKAGNYKTLAFIKKDSAINYVENEKLLVDKLSRDISNKACIPFLAVLKHQAEIETNASFNDLSGMICNNTDYIEAVTSDDISSNHIKGVRITKTFHKSIYRDLKKHFKREKISKEKLYRMAVFKHISAELKKRGINLEIIDEN
jgi:hypothetical protein